MSDVTGQFYANDSDIGYGAELLVGQGLTSPETFAAIPVMMKITPGAMTTGIVDATHLRSPARHREKKGTIRDSAAISLNGFYIPGHGAHKLVGGDGFNSTHNLIYMWRNVSENNYKIKYPDAFDDLEMPLRGTITKYQPGEISTEVIVPFDLDITPLQDYFVGAS